eukprot:6216735-Pyramimonas_sp.AAC.1
MERMAEWSGAEDLRWQRPSGLNVSALRRQSSLRLIFVAYFKVNLHSIDRNDGVRTSAVLAIGRTLLTLLVGIGAPDGG